MWVGCECGSTTPTWGKGLLDEVDLYFFPLMCTFHAPSSSRFDGTTASKIYGLDCRYFNIPLDYLS